MGGVVLILVAGVTVLGSTPSASAATPPYAVIATVPLTEAAGDMAVDPASNSLYISNPGANQLSVLDLGTNTIEATIPLPSRPGRIAVDAVAHRAYVVTGQQNTVTVINTDNNTVVGSIGGLCNPIGVAVDPGTHQVYVANYDCEVVSVIDTTTSPATLTNTGYVGSRPWAIAVDPVSHHAYVATLFGGTVAVLSGTTILKTVGGFAGPIQVTVDPSAQRAYVVNNNSEVVSLIDTSTDTVIAPFTAGSGPSDIAVDPRTHTAFVANRNDNSVSVIDQSDNSVVGTVAVGGFPADVEVDPRTHRVYVNNNTDHTISVLADQFEDPVITATATDRAGNRSSTRLLARTTSIMISGASMAGGQYVVHRGRTYTVLVAATKHPTYVYASPTPRHPAGGQDPFVRIGKHRWAVNVTFRQSMSQHTLWNMGIRVGRHTTIMTVRVVR